MPAEVIQNGGFIINLFMALIAIAASLISYLVYSENSIPDVVVYIEQDKDAKQILNLVIKNIGKGAAKNIMFKCETPLPQHAFDTTDTAEMTKGALVTGIPYLAPGGERSMMFGKYHELAKWFGNEKITVDITCERAKGILFGNRKIKNTSYLEVFSFSTVSASDNSIGNKIREELVKIRNEISKIKSGNGR
ncbi:hypothetical protein [Pectobacterium brasiliense]|uniref:hypothetical protein n=1 Tax=Pectobacterium brasiliense TaxID=180957 RepID=UPI0019699024|nr:hypothetical protein [Pectobacterium brasiliense]MBN3125727.1 hypothetical protein [Pectobacterium brasiliense]QSD22397.1 hypothetical protein H5A38_19295 [Pectobacterium brasiliense]